MRHIVIQIEGNIQWSVAQDPETRVWIGVCPALHLNAEGDTFADLMGCAIEAMGLLFMDLFREGELQSYLQQRGWAVPTTLPAPTTPVQFDAPFEPKRVRLEDLATAMA